MSDPAPVLPAQALPVQPLEYADRYTNGMNAATHAAFRRYARFSLFTAILSGLCVGESFLWLALHNMPCSVLHLALFTTTAVLGSFASRALLAANSSAGFEQTVGVAVLLDLLAGLGLMVLAVGPAIYVFMGLTDLNPEPWMIAVLAGAYACLMCSTPRHFMQYHRVGSLMRLNGATYIGGMRWLGNIKTGYEFLWLGICSITLLCALDHRSGNGDVVIFSAFASFFGCLGYGGLWVWMIVRHSLLLASLRR